MRATTARTGGLAAVADGTWLASDPIHHYSSSQGCLTQYMAVKQREERWGLQEYSVKLTFKADLTVF